MNYIPCTDQTTQSFFIPASIVDKHLKLATEKQLKVLLYYLRNMQSGISEEAVAEYFKLPLSEVTDALDFWVQAGVLVCIAAPAATNRSNSTEKVRSVKATVMKPQREEIAVIAATDEKLSFLIRESEMKFARALRQNEMSSLAWLYLDFGMNPSVILMIVEYAITTKNDNISFIEKTALKWHEAGIDSIEKADKEIVAMNNRRTAWGVIASAFGFGDRKPSQSELDFSECWIVQWGFSREMLVAAYNQCIDQKAKIDMRYINGILKNWYKNGIKNVADIEEKDVAAKSKNYDKKTTANDISAYDKKLVDKLINKDE